MSITGKKWLARTRSALLGLILSVAIVAAIAGVKTLQFGAMADAAALQVMPPEPVNVVETRREHWQPRLSTVGSIMPVRGTVVSAEAEGVVRSISFEPGSTVGAGDVLAQLDVDVEQAQLRAAVAAAERASLAFARAENLIAERSISKEEFDALQADMKTTAAQVDNIRAVIAKKVVRAPFAGKLGIRRISIGQYLEKGSPIVALYSLDPVYVDFSVPQQKLGAVQEGLSVTVASDAWPGKAFSGRITAIDPNVDPATRNVRVQATLENASGRLRPGMFVSVDVVTAQSQEVLLIPATAVLHAPFGDSIFIVEENADAPPGTTALVVRQQMVRLGARRGDFVVATEGAEPGDRIVSTGVFKLRSGMPVVIDEKLAPEFSTAPTPDNT